MKRMGVLCEESWLWDVQHAGIWLHLDTELQTGRWDAGGQSSPSRNFRADRRRSARSQCDGGRQWLVKAARTGYGHTAPHLWQQTGRAQ